MSSTPVAILQGVLVDEQVQFTLIELSRACGAPAQQLIALVDEGVLAAMRCPTPDSQDTQTTEDAAAPLHTHAWRFHGNALPRARVALRLARDLELDASGVALVLELLDRIDRLESRLRQLVQCETQQRTTNHLPEEPP